jgi:ADP-ribose pyrophosphatase YjhB (NUDIX family)
VTDPSGNLRPDDAPLGFVSPTGEPPCPAGPAADLEAPYARMAVVALIARPGSPGWFLVEHGGARPGWSPLGGRLERGEDLGAAVEREVFEETALQVRAAGPCYAYLTPWKGERLVAVTMVCRLVRWPAEVRLEEGLLGWRWATTDQWERLAAEGRSWWGVADVRRVAALAACLLEFEPT